MQFWTDGSSVEQRPPASVYIGGLVVSLQLSALESSTVEDVLLLRSIFPTEQGYRKPDTAIWRRFQCQPK